MPEVTAGLRERIREAAAEVWRDGLGGMTEADVLDRYADALLPVVEAHTAERTGHVRAAALREGARAIRGRDVDYLGMYHAGWLGAADYLEELVESGVCCKQTPVPQRECSASISGNCLREAQSETACATEDGECVHGGRAAAPQPVTESQGAAALERITVESVQQLVETRTRLAEVEADRDRLAAEVAELEKRLARSQQSRRNLRGLLEHHRDMGSLGMLRQHRNRLSRALRACARYRTDLGQLRAALSRALDLLGREHHAESSYTAQSIAILREAHDGTKETTR